MQTVIDTISKFYVQDRAEAQLLTAGPGMVLGKSELVIFHDSLGRTDQLSLPLQQCT
jgi:hypothetical protein